MRKLASIREISEVKPIKNADRIEVCVVDGWEVICKVNDSSFKVINPDFLLKEDTE